MTATITLFANKTDPTGPQLDGSLNAVGNLGVIPCTVSGTNALTLTAPAATLAYPITAYFNGLQISGIAVATNGAAMTARLGALGIINVYKDSASGPIACVGNEVILGNAFTLKYDSALNANTGGWHLITGTASGAFLPLSGGTITGNLSVTGSLNVAGPFSGASVASDLIQSGSVNTIAAANLLTSPFASIASLASVTQLMVGASAASITRILSGTQTVTFTVVPANTSQEQPFTLAGVQINDSIMVGPPSLAAQGIGYTGFVPAAGTVTLRALNVTAASLTPAGGLYRITAMGYT